MPSAPIDPAKKHRILRDVFGFQAFRPGQEPVIDALSRGEHVLAIMPTGSGKSLCFQVPALGFAGLTVVVSPLVALMQDQVAALKLQGVAAETINSSFSREDNVAVWRRVARGEIKLLYLSPERLLTERMIEALQRLPVSLIVVDEAHCISQWGPSFRPEYDGLSRLKEVFPRVPLAAFTATADDLTRKEILHKLFSGKASCFVRGFDRPNIHLAVQQKQEWKRQVLAFLNTHPGECGIVYCLSRKKTEETAQLLESKGIPALPYHAGMGAAEREAHQNAFMTRDGVVMVATIAFGMGIDKSNVRFVLHTDLPSSLEAYYQEFGRAGRDGQSAEALMLYGLDDIRMRRHFIETEGAEEPLKRRQHQRLDLLLSYCESVTCRRVPLLAYFGETARPCGNCDNCRNPVETQDGSDLARTVLAAVQATGQRFGATHIRDVLLGAHTARIRELGHDRLPVFGAARKVPKKELRSLLHQMAAGGVLKLDLEGHGGLSLTALGDALIRKDGSFRYRKMIPEDAVKALPAHGAEPASPASAQEAALLKKLKELRLELARERQMPAFVIFHDRTLEDMARKRPATKSEFARVNGVGEAKLRDFAEPFLALIAAADPV
ncbi:MAG: DNA helicase RecQ [Deltaproteobacteria bacterium]|nr:DNA helicase RecQ [Deltaproteobacteria bacterium]